MVFWESIDFGRSDEIDLYGKAPVADIEYSFAQLIEVCKWPHYDYKTYIKNAIAEYKKYAKTDVNVNTVVEDKSSKATYKVTSNKGKLTVTYNSSKNKNASKAVIPDLVKIKGKKYKVT